MPPRADAVAATLAADLDTLKATHPTVWSEVGPQLVDASSRGPAGLKALMERAHGDEGAARRRLAHRPDDDDASAALVRARLTFLGVQTILRTAALQAATAPTGATSATSADGTPLRFSRWSGTLINRLFFDGGLTRKAPSYRLFRWLWPLIPQRRLLMPLVQPQGIWCFYAREFLDALATRIDGRSCLELGAGDGSLARMLRARGVTLTAVDDASWSHVVTVPADVERRDAVAALAFHRPQVVLCAFPPPDNSFERRVFRTPSVELYIVITTKVHGAAGDWRAWQEQDAFDVEDNTDLARFVLPPEIEPRVLLFRRRAALSS